MKVRVRYQSVDGRCFGDVELKCMESSDGHTNLVAFEKDVVAGIAETNEYRRPYGLPGIVEDAGAVGEAECSFWIVDDRLELVRVVPHGKAVFGESWVNRKA